ncbi:MAG: neutral/alkaline non-lysosomal ceramidase N-terminal domain-containing protein [Phycisphaeraceae bacterium]
MALEIGLAWVDVTPPVGATMVGYTARQATGVGHPLRAEAVACRDGDGDRGGGGWVLVSVDAIGFTGEFSRRVRGRMAEVTGLPAEAHVLCGTHTHSGPSTIVFGRGESMGEVDRAYLAELEEKLVGLVREAWAGASPGVFETAWTEARELGHNRRVQREDGWGNEWEDVEGRHPGFFDPAVLLVAVRRPNGKRDGLIVNYGCHPVTLGPSSLELSADYVGYMKDRLEAEGAAGLVTFALAACGNINPRACIRVGAEHPKAMGEALAAVVMKAMGELKAVEPGAVASASAAWSITRTREGKKGRRKAGDVTETEVVAARAGELGLIAGPGELFSEFNKPLRAMHPARDTLIVTLANEYPGYIPTDAAQAEGAYEVTMAPCDGLEGALMETARAAVDGIQIEVSE